MLIQFSKSLLCILRLAQGLTWGFNHSLNFAFNRYRVTPVHLELTLSLRMYKFIYRNQLVSLVLPLYSSGPWVLISQLLMWKSTFIFGISCLSTATTQLQTRFLPQNKVVRERVNWEIRSPTGSPHQVTTYITCLLWFMWQNLWVVPFCILSSVFVSKLVGLFFEIGCLV